MHTMPPSACCWSGGRRPVPFPGTGCHRIAAAMPPLPPMAGHVTSVATLCHNTSQTAARCGFLAVASSGGAVVVHAVGIDVAIVGSADEWQSPVPLLRIEALRPPIIALPLPSSSLPTAAACSANAKDGVRHRGLSGSVAGDVIGVRVLLRPVVIVVVVDVADELVCKAVGCNDSATSPMASASSASLSSSSMCTMCASDRTVSGRSSGGRAAMCWACTLTTLTLTTLGCG